MTVDQLDRPDSIFHTVEALEPIVVGPTALRFRAVVRGRTWQKTDVRGSTFMKAVSVESSRDLTLSIDLVDPNVVRVRWSVADLPDTRPPGMLVREPTAVTGVRAVRGSAPLHCLRDMGPGRGHQMGSVETPFVELQGEQLRVRVWVNPYRLELFNSKSGQRVFGADGPEACVFRQNDDPGLSVVTGDSPSRHLFTTSFDLGHDEAIYGYGERFDAFGKQTRDVLLWQCDALGTTSRRAYKNVPFFMSDRGYGVFLHTAGALKASIGTRAVGRHVICLDDDALEYFVINGTTPTDVLVRYAELTGRSPIPPFWSFGIWMSRLTYKTRAEVEGVIDEMRRRDLGMDVVHLDPGWMDAKDWRCTLKFDEQAFPEPAEFMRGLRAKGVRVCLWQLPYIERESPLYQELAEQKAFAHGSDFAQTVIDYSSAAGLKALRPKFAELFNRGAAVIKTDFGEELPRSADLETGPGRFMHNLYPLLYNRAVFEMTADATGEGIVWARSAWAGSQRYPLHWGGDATSNWANLAAQVVGAMNFAMSGFTFWSSDIAGISGEPTPALYARWAQFGMLNTHVRFHSGYPVEPWNYGEEAERIVHDWIDLRYRLLPYIYGQAHLAAKSGLPMMKPMVLMHPEDRNVRGLCDQYYFGNDLLVAPMVCEGNRRAVYLPAGTWYELFTGRRHLSRGEWVDWEGDLRTSPVYLRGGSLLPLAAPRRHTGEAPLAPITLIYAPGPAGETLVCEPGEAVRLVAELSDGPVTVTATGRRLPRAWTIRNIESSSGGENVLGPLVVPTRLLGTLAEGDHSQRF